MRYWHTMTKSQQQSCFRLWNRHASSEPYPTFRRRFLERDMGREKNAPGSYFIGMMPSGLFIGIETDGYFHT